MEDFRQPLPLKFADLSEACGFVPECFEPILDVKDGDLVLLTKGQSVWLLGLRPLDDQLYRGSQRNRLVKNPPPGLPGRFNRSDLSAPMRVIFGIGDKSPDILGRSCNLDRLLDPDLERLDSLP